MLNQHQKKTGRVLIPACALVGHTDKPYPSYFSSFIS